MKESDPRIKDFTDWFHGLYKQKYGNSPFWDGKVFKVMPKCIAYFDGISREAGREGISWMKEAAQNYLSSVKSAWVLANKHPTYYFLTNPHIYLHEEEQPKPSRPIPEYVSSMQNWEAPVPCDIEKFKKMFLKQVIANPIVSMKGFCQTGPLLKKINPVAWNAARRILKDVVGEERCKRIYLQFTKEGISWLTEPNKEGHHDRAMEGPSTRNRQGRLAMVSGGGWKGPDQRDESVGRDEDGKTPELDCQDGLRDTGKEKDDISGVGN